MSAARTYVLTAGGTGGHLFPAQALAEQLTARGHRIVLMTDRRGQAYADRFPNSEIVTVSSGSPSGGIASKLRGAAQLTRGGFQALKHLRTIQPATVIGFGGYASFPALWAAARQKRPVVLHEQNAYLGRVNRVFGKVASAVALSFDRTRALDKAQGSRIEVTGNPVRQAVLAIRQNAYAEPDHTGPIRLLVFGGSQGASIFASTVPAAIANLPEKLKNRIHVTQQVRAEELEPVRAAYAEAGVDVELASFFDNMSGLLSDAHLILARAGASTVAELGVAGRPSVLVPYPYAADDHQTANAEAMASAGAAWVIANDKFDAATCQRTLEALLEDPATLSRMAGSAFALGRPEAAARLADLVEEIGAAA
ncbi:undecaprenyldiphospho-muramoylpentapeptide beta-N-acetylglucosaminyltransferase [Minwuia sp.]|uniref:undecaprenyldiphospho-muramoylpentapeptide beta-N-acetylglucosaminyltransferase n=1 Tax=Minwuia sp. TaxID=2493630 RepID=UPI003A91A1B6